MGKTLLKRVRGVKPLLTNPSNFLDRETLDLRDAQPGFLLNDSRKTISRGIEDHNF